MALAPNRIVVRRTIIHTYSVPLNHYGELTLDEAVTHEEEIATEEAIDNLTVEELLDSEVKISTVVGTVYDPGLDPAARPDEVQPLVLDLETEAPLAKDP